MQGEGKPMFLRHHSKEVKGVVFSPTDRYLFTSGGNDGKINIYRAHNRGFHKHEMSFKLASPTTGRTITGLKFTPDGTKILASSTSHRLAVLDVHRGHQIQSYENCVGHCRGRAALATDPNNPNMVVCCGPNGKSLNLLDIRMPLPCEFLFDLHTSVIRDICFLNRSWPFVKSHQSGLVSLSGDGVCKTTTLEGLSLHTFSVGYESNSIATTPEDYGSSRSNGLKSHIVIGGDTISSYTPENSANEKHKKFNYINHYLIWKLKYTSNGSLLYSACAGGKVKRFRRMQNDHEYLGDVICHKADVYDMDISPYNEFLVTASKDHTVGILHLGPPNHGDSSYYELT